MSPKSLFVLFILFILISSCQSQAAPPKTHQPITLKELWRIGDNGDVFFGEITTTTIDDQGNVYILDSKQKQVLVIDSNGNHARTLSREGDGPGEIRDPSDLFITHDNQIAISEGFPGGLVFLQPDGTPSGRSRVTPQGVGVDKICFLDNATSLNGSSDGAMVLVWGGQQTVDGKREQYRSISHFSQDLREITRYHETRHPRDSSRPAIEANDYFPQDYLHCVGPDGRLYIAPDRNNYRIQVFATNGQQLLSIDHEFQTRKRNKIELEYIQELYGPGSGNSHGTNLRPIVSETVPDIEALHIGADGNLWIQNSRSYIDQAAGILLTYDVFGPEGHLLYQQPITCAGNGFRDRIVPLGDGRWLRLVGAIAGYRPQAVDLDEEDDVLEVICYVEE